MTNKVNVRKATAKDLPAILEVMKIGSTADHTDFIKQSVKAGQCQAALMDDKVVGFGILGTSLLFHKAFMELLIVHPGYRRQGVGTAIIRRLEKLCATKKFFTSTNQSNIPAQKTYESLGFTRSGYIENLDEGDPEIIYFKLLTGGESGG
jgi:ribosomal protein S18 acetylase RimI-like enzyme